MEEKELIKKLFDYMIGLIEVNMVQREKQDAVKRQDYETAACLRGREVHLIESIPSIEEMKELRAKLD